MSEARWTPRAELDLERILHYIAIEQRRPEIADRFAYDFRDAALQAAAKPQLGGRHNATPTDWRYHQYKRWLIFYRPSKVGIEVMRVVDPARDLYMLFRDL